MSQPCRWNCMNAAFMLYEQAGRGRGRAGPGSPEPARTHQHHKPRNRETPGRTGCPVSLRWGGGGAGGGGRGSGSLGDVGYPPGELDPGVEAQLVEDVGDVRFDGALGQEKPGCDLAVAEVVGDEPGDVQLPAGEHDPRPGLDRRGRPGRLLVVNGEGSAFVDRHRESTPEGRVESARAKTACRQP